MAEFLLRLDDSELEALRGAAAARGRSMNEVALEGLRAVTSQGRGARADTSRDVRARRSAEASGGSMTELLTFEDALAVLDE